jgi:hypothetical protein
MLFEWEFNLNEDWDPNRCYLSTEDGFFSDYLISCDILRSDADSISFLLLISSFNASFLSLEKYVFLNF